MNVTKVQAWTTIVALSLALTLLGMWFNTEERWNPLTNSVEQHSIYFGAWQ
jgi:hypothetical protein